VAGGSLHAVFSLKDGGSLFELDFKPRAFNFLNVLTRRIEGYHRRLKCDNGTMPLQARPPASLHALSRVKEEGLQNILTYDWYQRFSFVDHFLDPGTTPEGFSLSRYGEMGDFIEAPYTLVRMESDAATAEALLVMQREGTVLVDGQETPMCVTKQFRINDAARRIHARYTLENRSPREVALWFAVEFNITLLAGEDHLRYFHVPGSDEEQLYMNTRATFSAISAFSARDDRNGFGMEFSVPDAADLWLFPLETVSQSEGGLERTYQGSSVLLSWQVQVPPAGSQQREVCITLYENEGPDGGLRA
jgi:alpha-amylase